MATMLLLLNPPEASFFYKLTIDERRGPKKLLQPNVTKSVTNRWNGNLF